CYVSIPLHLSPARRSLFHTRLTPPFFFFTHPPTPEIYPLSLHDALPISMATLSATSKTQLARTSRSRVSAAAGRSPSGSSSPPRSEEHTSELQSLTNLVCRLLLEKKKQQTRTHTGLYRNTQCTVHV